MRRFEMKKLVRDKILENIKKRGSEASFKHLDDNTFLKELKNKFQEELDELDLNDPENIKNELADLQEILDNILKTLKINKIDLEKFQKEKIEKVGGFDKKIFIDIVDLSDDDEWGPYYEKKFKELV